jgi:hypothetical protein
MQLTTARLVGFPAYPPCRGSLASHALVTCGSERDLFGAPKDRGQDAARGLGLIYCFE